jgi:hypothetical protein
MGSVHARGDIFLTFGLKALTETNTSRLATVVNTWVASDAKKQDRCIGTGSNRLLLLFMSVGWHYVSELRPSTGLLFIPQMMYEYGDMVRLY